jgi:pilus assembly protein Flp/PilA
MDNGRFVRRSHLINASASAERPNVVDGFRKSEIKRNQLEKKMKEKLMQFLRDEEGLTTVEYAVAGALVAAAVVAAFKALGVQVTGVITTITGAIVP